MTNAYQKSGLTLVELLVAIGILAILTAVLVPQLRMVTKERGIREAARIVGSQFAEAANRARATGASGIALIRNPNYLRPTEDGHHVYYSSTSIFQLKLKRPYVGNENGDVARVASLPVPSVNYPNRFEVDIEIPTPFDPAVTVDAYSTISIDGSSNRLTIVNAPTVAMPPAARPATITITVLFEPYLPIPPIQSLHSFVVERLPEISTNTEVLLPRGYHINLNYSGYERPDRDVDNHTWSCFSEDLEDNLANQKAIFILFDSTGGVDRVFTNGLSAVPTATWYQDDSPLSSLFFCVAQDDVKHSFDLTGAELLPRSYVEDLTAGGGPDQLNEPSLLWVMVNHLNGNVGVGENGTVTLIPNPRPVGGALATTQKARLFEALRIGSKRRIATQ